LRPIWEILSISLATISCNYLLWLLDEEVRRYLSWRLFLAFMVDFSWFKGAYLFNALLAMFLRAKDCFGQAKDSKFIVDILISAIEQVGSANVVQVITDNAPICKVAGLIVESRYHHIWTPCIVHNLNLILEEVEAKTEWIKEVTGQAREIIKFITNHH
jgi:hypothetical protein